MIVHIQEAGGTQYYINTDQIAYVQLVGETNQIFFTHNSVVLSLPPQNWKVLEAALRTLVRPR